MNEDNDDKDLKIKALLQRLGEQAQTYENAIADLRVTLTRMDEAVKSAVQNSAPPAKMQTYTDDSQFTMTLPQGELPEMVVGDVKE